MIKLRFREGCDPSYQTEWSSGADLVASESLVIPARTTVKVPTGVWIESVLWDRIPAGFFPELQVRARSGLAYKHGITLTNGVGTIDLDYPEEICVLLWNTKDADYSIAKGDRIAQLVLNMVARCVGLNVGGQRLGGFGSTSQASL
ncbi:MAG: dUTP diphosphatase [Oligoflexales bacterium]|nr:dUTP diphosphatase [Oligoflexales bacterium]